jgi:hypothetical protein
MYITADEALCGKARTETLLKFYKVMAVPTLLYGSERCIEAAEGTTSGYRRTDHIKN